jgi:hypothetical protein
MAKQHHIEDENLINEIFKIGQMMMGGQVQGGTPGSLPGVSETKPETVQGGQAGGVKSLNMPLAGNAQE